MTERTASLVLPLGSNPSPLFSLAWALTADGTTLRSVWVVTSPRGLVHLRRALEAEWHRLRTIREGLLPALPDLQLIEAGDDDGSARATAALGEAMWQAFHEALQQDVPVFCGLGGGRHRSMASLVTTLFSLHARVQDRLVDVRYGRKEIEATPAFLYPGQQNTTVLIAHNQPIEASSVEVHVDDIPVARLRRLLPRTERPSSFLHAVALGQRSLDALSLPEVIFNLDAPQVTIQGNTIKMSNAELLVLAGYALARLEGTDDGWLYADTLDPIHAALSRLRHKPWVQDIQSEVIQAVLHAGVVPSLGDAWRQLRSRAGRAFARGGRLFAPEHASVLMLERRRKGNEHLCRLRIPPAAFSIVIRCQEIRAA